MRRQGSEGPRVGWLPRKDGGNKTRHRLTPPQDPRTLGPKQARGRVNGNSSYSLVRSTPYVRQRHLPFREYSSPKEKGEKKLQSSSRSAFSSSASSSSPPPRVRLLLLMRVWHCRNPEALGRICNASSTKRISLNSHIMWHDAFLLFLSFVPLPSYLLCEAKTL